MSRPWWLWLATASFVGYFLFLNSSIYYSRELLGFTYRTTDEGLVIADAEPGAPLAQAGVRSGDRLLGINNLTLRDGFDMMVMRGNVGSGSTIPIRVERDGAVIDLAIRPLQRRLRFPDAVFPLFLLPMIISLVLGVLVAWRGSGTPAALGAWLLVSIGCAFLPIWPNGMAQQWRDLPLPIALLIWPAAISSLLVPVLLFVFCARGWQPVLPWRATLLLTVPALATIAYVAFYVINAVYDPARAIALPMPFWLQVVGPAFYPLYGAASAALLFVNRQRLADITERRRATTLLAGTVTGVIGMALVALGMGSLQSGRPIPGAQAIAYAGGLIFCALPLAFAYATLRQRMFDLRVIARLGLQYALARGFILALIPVALVVLAVDLVRQGDQPLRSILATRSWTYAAFLSVIAVIYANRTRWMTALDRRFFRERYAAQQILRDVVQDISGATDFDTAAARVVTRVNSALHPVMAAVLKKPRSSDTFTPITALPATHRVPVLTAASPIPQVVRALGRPIAFGAQGLGDVPADQQRWLTESGVELIVPIVADASRDEAVLALGPRRSEEPYSKEDLELLSAVGASLALLMGRAPALGQTETLVTSSRPAPAIAKRYRIERPIGEGGMGVVYAAVDETLDRAVAIKVIKDQHLLGSEGLSRFQREARTAASLSHPNIVTVHDYGVDDSGSPYLVMELLDGQSLRAALRREQRMPAPRALPILAGIAAAVDAAHAKGVIHRDLKPENVFLLRDSTHAKILDYGIAKAVTGATTHATTGGVLGTLPYMSPEQASGGTASPAWDVWSLSVIAYELLSGRHPFNGGLPISAAVPIRTHGVAIDDRIATAIDRALSLNPSDRPATASALIHSLQR